jgi:thiamine monophosphate kinase
VHADARKLARRTRRAPLDHALHDGEDHELIATLAARDFARAARAVPGLVEIGRVRAGTGLVLLDEARAARRWRRGRGGYEHGA